MTSQFFLWGTHSPCDGSCKEKPMLQVARQRREALNGKYVVRHNLIIPLGHEGEFQNVDCPS